MLLLPLLLLASASDTLAAPAATPLPHSAAPSPPGQAAPSPDRGALPASVAETDLIWTASGCKYVPAERIEDCRELVRMGRPFHPSMRLPVEKELFHPVEASDAGRGPRPQGRPTVHLTGQFGYAGNFVMSGATIGVGGVWQHVLLQAGAGFAETRQTRLSEDGEELKVRKAWVAEGEVLLGDHFRPTPLAGFGGRLSDPSTGFLSVGYCIPRGSGAITALARLGRRFATFNVIASYRPKIGRRVPRRTSPQGY